MATEAGRHSSVSGCKVKWCFVHVCVDVNKTFYRKILFIEIRIYKMHILLDEQSVSVAVMLILAVSFCTSSTTN